MRFILPAIGVFLLAGSAGIPGADRWRTGSVVAVEMNGHGPDPASKTLRARVGEIYWTYCFAEGNRSFSAVSRVSPEAMGIPVRGRVKFQLGRDRIQLLNARGKRYTLRLANANACR